MALSPIPRGVYPSITDISPQMLARKGIRLVLADLDNTLVAYRVTEPPAELMAWKQALEAAGIRLLRLLDSRKSRMPGRAKNFAEICRTTGHPLSGPLRQAEKGRLPPGHGAHGGEAGRDRYGGGPDFYRHPGGQQRRSDPPAGPAHPSGGQPLSLCPLRH